MTTPASTLGPPDSHHLRAAEGWLELGNAAEAGEEIARIAPQRLTHPDVLEMRWTVCAAGQSWDAALEVAELLVKEAPDRSSGWVHRAYAMRRAKAGGLARAWEALLPAFRQFPRVSVIPYNLACYAAQFGRLEEGWDWLQKAIAAEGNVASIKQRALIDPDLEPLWDRIQGL